MSSVRTLRQQLFTGRRSQVLRRRVLFFVRDCVCLCATISKSMGVPSQSAAVVVVVAAVDSSAAVRPLFYSS